MAAWTGDRVAGNCLMCRTEAKWGCGAAGTRGPEKREVQAAEARPGGGWVCFPGGLGLGGARWRVKVGVDGEAWPAGWGKEGLEQKLPWGPAPRPSWL